MLPKAELEHYCELIAALKLRTTNKQGRHLSTRRAIELIEDYGVETPQGLIRAPKGLLSRSTVNDYLSRWKLDQPRLTRQPPAVRFQAEFSNACWQFDLSPSDLKQVEAPDDLPRQPFNAELQEYHYPSKIAAKLAIADDITKPLEAVWKNIKRILQG